MTTVSSSSSMRTAWVAVLILLAATTTTLAQDSNAKLHARPAYMGPRDRFWRHHREQKTLIINGVELYDTIDNCLFKDEGALTQDEQAELQTLLEHPDEPNSPHKKIGKRIVDEPHERFGNIILVEVEHAITPVQVKAVQRLAHCVRTHIPEYFEVRAMYKEFNLDDDPGLGGNTPTHLMPFLGIYLPQICTTILQTIRFAYDAAGWQGITIRDKLLGKLSDDPDEPLRPDTGVQRAAAMPMPEELGFRASEHLHYDDFPLLDAHHDGSDTSYTVNFAFAGPDEYQGGYLYVIDNAGEKTFFKPNKYSCIVFMGGHYMHGVTKITGGHREMFSNEMWFNPDAPLGNTLWNARSQNMEDFIRGCNKVGHQPGSGPCNVTYSDSTQHGLSREEIIKRLNEGKTGASATANARYEASPNAMSASEIDLEDSEDDSDEEENFSDDEDEEFGQWDDQDFPINGGEFWPEEERYAPNDVYFSAKDEPNFLIPKYLHPGEMSPLYWRDNRERIKDDEAFAIGLPEELLKEFTAYVEKNGMLRVARKLVYPETNVGDDQVEPFERGLEHKLYTLDDGMTWGTMRPKWDGMDMIWIDPGDEECFESLLNVLRRGNFDTVLDSVAQYFDLDGLMVQGIGPIFLSHFDHDPDYNQIHHDLIEAKGSFYNIIVPLYIPESGATLYVGDSERSKTIQMRYNVGTLLGAGTRHGTAECDYREQKDVRLSVAIYLADVNEDNVEIVASDSTSLWPSQGDVHWFQSQEGRLWRRDGSRSLKTDKGRVPLHVADKRPDCAEAKDLCITDPAGFRLECPKTCRVYLEDDVYYAQLKAMVEEKPVEETPVNEIPSTTRTITV